MSTVVVTLQPTRPVIVQLKTGTQGPAGTAGAALPLNSVQYNNAGALGGMANVAHAGGDLCVGVGRGTVATDGDIRASFFTKMRVRGLYNTAVNRTLFETYDLGNTPGARETYSIGASSAGDDNSLFETGEIWARTIVNLGLGVFPYPIQVILEDLGGGLPGQFHTFGSNVVIGGGDSNTGPGTNGIIFFDGVAPSATTTAGTIALYSLTNRFKYITSAGVNEFIVGRATTDTFTNKTFAVDATGNVFKQSTPRTGDVLVDNGTVFAPVAKGSNGTFLGVSGGVVGYYTPSGTITGIASTGAGAGIVANGTAGANVQVKSLLAGSNVTITNNTNDITIAASSAAVPTGTGFWHITAGSSDAASKKVDTTASADVTVPATANGVVRVASSALTNSANFTEDGSGNAVLATSLAMGTTSVATTGTVRLKDGGSIVARNSTDAANLVLMKCLTNLLVVGADDALANYASITRVWSSTATQLGNNSDGYGIDLSSGQVDLALNGQVVRAGGPIIGRATNSSPYSGCNAEVIVADPAGGTTTLTASQYATTFIQVANSITTGTHTGSGGNLDFPTPAAGNGYPMLVYNGTNGSVTCRKAGGGGGTVVIGIGKSAWIWVMNGGVYRMTADA